MEIKYCTKCKEGKELTQFHKKKSTIDGYRHDCKLCANSASKRYRAENPEKVSESAKRGRIKNSEQISESSRKYREANRNVCNARTQRWQQENRETHLNNKRKYYDENREEIRAKNNAYAKESKGKRVVREQRRRSAMSLLTSDFTEIQWANCLEAFDCVCAYCNSSQGKLQQDHVIPVTKGGGYTVNNIIPACPSCNASKQDREMREWFMSKLFFSEDNYESICMYLAENGVDYDGLGIG